ncbi:MAG: hypothetical protein U1E76_16790 [Planctomycetota bacterium]
MAVTSDTMAAVLDRFARHAAGEKLTVKTRTADRVEADCFCEWTEMQQELQASAGAARQDGQATPRVASGVMLAELMRERPMLWTCAVFVTAYWLGWLVKALS